MKQSIINYETRITAFIDILGFKEMIKKSDENSDNIQLIIEILEFLKTWESPEKWDLRFINAESNNSKKGINFFEHKEHINVTTFSDSIVISIKVDNNENEIMSTLISYLAYIGAILIKKGILIRGGMTIGRLIHNDNGTVFGPAFIEAYQLESVNAKFPRIILSNKLVEKLNYPIHNNANRYPYHQYIKRFDDGCVGFHQMKYYQVLQNSPDLSKNELTSGLERIRQTIIRGLDLSFEDPEVFLKYKWLKRQYNRLLILNESDEEQFPKIKELNPKITNGNIHYQYTDDFYNSQKK